MKKKGLTFKKIYLIYLLILAVGMAAALFYVNSILHHYEESLPESCVHRVADTLVAEASQGNLFTSYSLAAATPGELESHLNLQEAYQKLYTDGELTISQQSSASTEDELVYHIENNGFPLAEVKLKAQGPAVTKLILLTSREWEVEYVKPLLEARDYTLSLPADFTVSVNDIALTPDASSEADKEVTYTLENIYLEPVLDIKDQEGNTVSYTLKKNQIVAEFYNYSLTLPAALQVKVNGERFIGEALDETLSFYHIRSLTKPEVLIMDAYGNEFAYTGGNKLPLTYKTIYTDSRYTVEVNGKAVSSDMITSYANPEYDALLSYVSDLPAMNEFQIAVLQADAEITVKDEQGNPIAYDTTAQEVTVSAKGLDTVPEEIAAQVDVLHAAQQWSLFMSADLPFAKLSPYLLYDSYQYKMAKRYSTGIDITFTSNHTLLDPAFTENTVTNFVWLSDNCFSVDISFVKHMYLVKTHAQVDDVMNDRFYFVKNGETGDNTTNPVWKIASMKEIVNNE